jgi:uncharacterized membrane protein YdbT with pleckstrin-like domain
VLATAHEEIRVDSRRHGVVLVRPLTWALALAVGGVLLVLRGWPASPVGAGLVAVAACIALRAVVRWERTRVVVTTEKLFVVHGIWRRRAAAVRFDRVAAVEVEQSVLGRALGYGTLVAGNLEIPYVPDPSDVCDEIR